MKKLILTLFISFASFITINAQNQILIDEIDLKKTGIKLNIDSIVKFYNEIAPENIHYKVTQNSLEISNDENIILYSYDIETFKLYLIKKNIFRDTIKIDENIKLNHGQNKVEITKFYSFDEIIYALRNQKYINTKETIIKDTLNSTIEHIIPKNFAYALIYNTKNNIETIENGMEYYSMFTKDNKICPDCKIIDTLNFQENQTFVNNFLSLSCMKDFIPYACVYTPHDAIVYYNNKNEIIAYIEICFDCGDVVVVNLSKKNSHYFQMRDLNIMNNTLIWESENSKLKLSPKLMKMFFNRMLLMENEKIERNSNEFKEKGVIYYFE